MTRTTPAAARGFTLIELLIVIAILGVLAAVLVPQLFETNQAAYAAATEANMSQLETGVNSFQRKHGINPPDDLRANEELAKSIKADWKADNGKNTGIESLVCFLSQSSQSGLDLNGLADVHVNTDADDHGVELPLLRSRARIEIADAWRTPLVYFSKLGMERPQTVMVDVDGDVVQVKCKRRADGVPYGAGRFQLLSAGRDRTFGTDDDLVWPQN
jgi:prepilin-type N-terminal cleavage/methylation domain-containing protein